MAARQNPAQGIAQSIIDRNNSRQQAQDDSDRQNSEGGSWEEVTDPPNSVRLGRPQMGDPDRPAQPFGDEGDQGDLRDQSYSAEPPPMLDRESTVHDEMARLYGNDSDRRGQQDGQGDEGDEDLGILETLIDPSDGEEEIPEELPKESKKANETFARMRVRMKELEQKLAEAGTEEVAELKGRIAAMDYIKSDEFKQRYDAPIVNAANRAASILITQGGMTKEEAQEIIRTKSIRDRSQMVSRKVPGLEAYLNQALFQMDNAIIDREQAIQEASTAPTKIMETVQQSRQKRLTTQLPQIAENLETDVLGIFKPREGDSPKVKAWNKAVDGYRREALDLAVKSNLDPKTALEVVLARQYQKLIPAMLKNARGRGGPPKPGVRSNRGSDRGGGNVDQPKNAEQAARIVANRVPRGWR